MQTVPSGPRRWKVLLAFAPALLYAAFIFFMSSRAIPTTLAPPQGVDKLAHFAAYGILGVLLAFAFARAGLRAVYVVVWASLLGALYGVSDELHQSFVPERSAEVLDAVADAIGSFMGALGFVVLRSLWHRQRSRTNA